MTRNKSLISLIVDDYKEAFPSDAHVTPDIPEKKMNGAIKGIAQNAVLPAQVLLVWDSTVFGSATEGFVLTRDTLYYRQAFQEPRAIRYRDIVSVEYREHSGKSGKKKGKGSVVITGPDGSWVVENETSLDYQAFANWLNALHAAALDDGEADLLESRPLEDMPAEIRLAYVRVVINFLLADDGVLNQEEFGQLYSLMARLKLSARERFELLVYVNDPQPSDALVEGMCALLDDLARRDVLFSLAKDLVGLHRQTGRAEEDCRQNPFIQDFARTYDISDGQLDLFVQAIDNDRRLFDDETDDAALEKGFRQLAANSAAVGVPLAAIYLSGSVVGLGAAGISSGLTALGLGGLFGFSGVVTGLGAVILLGLGVRKGVELLTGQNQLDRRRRKEALLLDIKRHLQTSINILMEDIDNFTEELAREIARSEEQLFRSREQKERIRRLVERLRLMGRSGSWLSRKSTEAEIAALRQKLPRTLNLDRLTGITSEPTTRHYRDMVLGFYQETRDTKKPVYMLRDDLTRDEAASLAAIFETLDYFSATTLAREKLHSLQSLGRHFRK